MPTVIDPGVPMMTQSTDSSYDDRSDSMTIKRRALAVSGLALMAATTTLALGEEAAHASTLTRDASRRIDAGFCNVYVESLHEEQPDGGTPQWFGRVQQDPPSKDGGCLNTLSRMRVGCFNADGSTIYVSNFLYGSGPDPIVVTADVGSRGFCQVDASVTHFGEPWNNNASGFWQTRIYGDGEVRYFKNGQPV